jgi:hypothetical protein
MLCYVIQGLSSYNSILLLRVFTYVGRHTVSRDCSGSEDEINNAQELKLRTDVEDLTNYGNVLVARASTNTYAGARTHVNTHSVRSNK